MKEKILFVTKGGENTDEGFSYVLELAKALNAGIAVLVVYPRQMMTSFEDVMSAAAFAEAGDFQTVRTLMEEQGTELRETEEKKIKEKLVHDFFLKFLFFSSYCSPYSIPPDSPCIP